MRGVCVLFVVTLILMDGFRRGFAQIRFQLVDTESSILRNIGKPGMLKAEGLLLYGHVKDTEVGPLVSLSFGRNCHCMPTYWSHFYGQWHQFHGFSLVLDKCNFRDWQSNGRGETLQLRLINFRLESSCTRTSDLWSGK